MSKKIWTNMAGTEGTGEYVVVADTRNRGRIGVRVDSARGVHRIRIEPYNKKAARVLAATFTPEMGWKQPGDGGQNRFSTTVPLAARDEVTATVRRAVTAMIEGGGKVRLNKLKSEHLVPVLGAWWAVVDTLRARKVPGSNLASRWNLNTVLKKVNGGHTCNGETPCNESPSDHMHAVAHSLRV